MQFFKKNKFLLGFFALLLILFLTANSGIAFISPLAGFFLLGLLFVLLLLMVLLFVAVRSDQKYRRQLQYLKDIGFFQEHGLDETQFGGLAVAGIKAEILKDLQFILSKHSAVLNELARDPPLDTVVYVLGEFQSTHEFKRSYSINEKLKEILLSETAHVSKETLEFCRTYFEHHFLGVH